MASTSKTKHNTNCCVYNCHSSKHKDRSIHFHYFPKKNSGIKVKIVNALGVEELIDKRKAWEKVLLMGKPVTDSMRVCSTHFKNEDYCAKGVQLKQPKLKRHAVPSLNLPQKSFLKKESKEKDTRKERLRKRQRDVENQPLVDFPVCEKSETELEDQELSQRHYEDLTEDEKVLTNEKTYTVDKGVQVKSGDLFVTFTTIIKKDNHLNSLTGIPTFKLLNCPTTLVSDLYPDQKQHKLAVKDKIVLVLMKLKMALKFNVLAFLFQVSPTLCKTIFVDYVLILSNVLKPSIHWPSFEECQKNMPLCFSEFRNTRIILDCLEVPIENPNVCVVE